MTASPERKDLTWSRALALGLAWQALPAGWMLLDAWDTPSVLTLILRAVVFIGVPVLAGLAHRTWRMWMACVLVPILGMGFMMTVFMLIMPTGRW